MGIVIFSFAFSEIDVPVINAHILISRSGHAQYSLAVLKPLGVQGACQTKQIAVPC